VKHTLATQRETIGGGYLVPPQCGRKRHKGYFSGLDTFPVFYQQFVMRGVVGLCRLEFLSIVVPWHYGVVEWRTKAVIARPPWVADHTQTATDGPQSHYGETGTWTTFSTRIFNIRTGKVPVFVDTLPGRLRPHCAAQQQR